ncbi:MAG: cyclase family protein [Dehalococcoidia bacterium]|nr:cyclase family protein [Dehalococcoidia bacterium]
MRVIDISVAISSSMHIYPGDPAVEVQPASAISKGDSNNSSRLVMGSHTGTHVDSPRHFIQDMLSVDKLPLDVLVGKAYVAEILTTTQIGVKDLEKAAIPPGTKRIIFKTVNSKLIWKAKDFQPDYISLSVDGAKWLLQMGVRLIGIDYLSIEQFKSPQHEVHHVLLEANVVILEGLNLTGVSPGEYTLCCLPLKISGGDGAPARTVLIEE